MDCVYDAIGGAFSEAALRAMAWKGRFLVVGFASGEIPKIPLNLTLLKGCAILGVYLGRIRQARAARRIAENMARIFDWAARKGCFRPMSTRCCRSHEIAEALNMLKERKAQGKIVLADSANSRVCAGLAMKAA